MELRELLDELGIEPHHREAIEAFLAPLRVKAVEHYNHCLRVAALAREIGRFTGMDDRALFYAGLLHDTGKALVSPQTLEKTDSWTEEDAREMEAHVLDGYRLLRGRFDFSADIIAWHHRFQRRAYPKQPPDPLHDYSTGTQVTLAMYGRLLALADTYDALHRINSASEGKALSNAEIRERMLTYNPDQRVLVENLYSNGVLT